MFHRRRCPRPSVSARSAGCGNDRCQAIGCVGHPFVVPAVFVGEDRRERKRARRMAGWKGIAALKETRPSMVFFAVFERTNSLAG